jgi:hypothetical protein
MMWSLAAEMALDAPKVGRRQFACCASGKHAIGRLHRRGQATEALRPGEFEAARHHHDDIMPVFCPTSQIDS